MSTLVFSLYNLIIDSSLISTVYCLLPTDIIHDINSLADIPAFSIAFENGSLTTFQQDASEKNLQDTVYAPPGIDRETVREHLKDIDDFGLLIALEAKIRRLQI